MHTKICGDFGGRHDVFRDWGTIIYSFALAQRRGGTSSIQILPETSEPFPLRAIYFPHPSIVLAADDGSQRHSLTRFRIVRDCPLSP